MQRLAEKQTNRAHMFAMELGMLTKQEAAETLQVTRATIDRYVKSGKLIAKKTGDTKQSRCYFLLTDVKKLLGI